jgi:hypothetical protein
MGDKTAVPRLRALWLRRLLLAGGLAAMASPGWAANTCPWMNEATASGLLGAEATGTFSGAVASVPASCMFTEISPRGIRALAISVEIDTDGSSRVRALLRDCHDAPETLRAIGNEALSCMVMRPHRVHAAFVAGRVRDHVFSISISTTVKNDPVLTPAMLKTKVEIAADQVAGNLF